MRTSNESISHVKILVCSWVKAVDTEATQCKSNAEKRLTKLGKIASELINSLATQKIDGKMINVADIYFVLSQALQQVSFMNLIEIEDFKQKRPNQQKMVI